MGPYNKTKHRQEILSLFAQTHILTAAEIKEKLPSVDIVTIYRTLKRLTDSGIVKEVKHSSKYASYELNTDHQHFVCSRCLRVFPVEIDQSLLLLSLKTTAGEIRSIHLDISGICVNCK